MPANPFFKTDSDQYLPVEDARFHDLDTRILPTGEHTRVTGYDAPELGTPEHPAYKYVHNVGTVRHTAPQPRAELGLEYANTLASQGNIFARRTGQQDRYGRPLEQLRTADGTDLGIKAIELGLASPYNLQATPEQREALLTYRARQLGVESAFNGMTPYEKDVFFRGQRELKSARLGPMDVVQPVKYRNELDPASPAYGQGDFAKGLSRFRNQTLGAIHAASAMTGQLFGNKNVERRGMEKYQEFMQGVGLHKGVTFEELQKDPDASVVDWAQGALGEGLPSLAAMLGTGGVTGFAGKQLVKMGIKHQVSDRAKQMAIRRGLTDHKALNRAMQNRVLAGEAAQARMAAAQKYGGYAGGYGFSLSQEAGSIYGELKELGIDDPSSTALAFGAVSAGLDFLAFRSHIDRVFGGGSKIRGKGLTQNTKLKFVADVTKGLGAGALVEGSTEGMQEVIAIAARMYEDPSFDPINNEKHKEQAWMRIISAAAAGAVVGGATGGTGGLRTATGNYLDTWSANQPPPPPADPVMTPVQEASVQATPAHEASVQATPAQATPAQETPNTSFNIPDEDYKRVMEIAAELDKKERREATTIGFGVPPVQQAPAQQAPAQQAPAQQAPVQEAPAQEAHNPNDFFGRFVNAQEAPAQEAPAQEAPAQEAPGYSLLAPNQLRNIQRKEVRVALEKQGALIKATLDKLHKQTASKHGAEAALQNARNALQKSRAEAAIQKADAKAAELSSMVESLQHSYVKQLRKAMSYNSTEDVLEQQAVKDMAENMVRIEQLTAEAEYYSSIQDSEAAAKAVAEIDRLEAVNEQLSKQRPQQGTSFSPAVPDAPAATPNRGDVNTYLKDQFKKFVLKYKDKPEKFERAIATGEFDRQAALWADKHELGHVIRDMQQTAGTPLSYQMIEAFGQKNIENWVTGSSVPDDTVQGVSERDGALLSDEGDSTLKGAQMAEETAGEEPGEAALVRSGQHSTGMEALSFDPVSNGPYADFEVAQQRADYLNDIYSLLSGLENAYRFTVAPVEMNNEINAFGATSPETAWFKSKETIPETALTERGYALVAEQNFDGEWGKADLLSFKSKEPKTKGQTLSMGEYIMESLANGFPFGKTKMKSGVVVNIDPEHGASFLRALFDRTKAVRQAMPVYHGVAPALLKDIGTHMKSGRLVLDINSLMRMGMDMMRTDPRFMNDSLTELERHYEGLTHALATLAEYLPVTGLHTLHKPHETTFDLYIDGKKQTYTLASLLQTINKSHGSLVQQLHYKQQLRKYYMGIQSALEKGLKDKVYLYNISGFHKGAPAPILPGITTEGLLHPEQLQAEVDMLDEQIKSIKQSIVVGEHNKAANAEEMKLNRKGPSNDADAGNLLSHLENFSKEVMQGENQFEVNNKTDRPLGSAELYQNFHGQNPNVVKKGHKQEGLKARIVELERSEARWESDELAAEVKNIVEEVFTMLKIPLSFKLIFASNAAPKAARGSAKIQNGVAFIRLNMNAARDVYGTLLHEMGHLITHASIGQASKQVLQNLVSDYEASGYKNSKIAKANMARWKQQGVAPEVQQVRLFHEWMADNIGLAMAERYGNPKEKSRSKHFSSRAFFRKIADQLMVVIQFFKSYLGTGKSADSVNAMLDEIESRAKSGELSLPRTEDGRFDLGFSDQQLFDPFRSNADPEGVNRYIDRLSSELYSLSLGTRQHLWDEAKFYTTEIAKGVGHFAQKHFGMSESFLRGLKDRFGRALPDDVQFLLDDMIERFTTEPGKGGRFTLYERVHLKTTEFSNVLNEIVEKVAQLPSVKGKRWLAKDKAIKAEMELLSKALENPSLSHPLKKEARALMDSLYRYSKDMYEYKAAGRSGIFGLPSINYLADYVPIKLSANKIEADLEGFYNKMRQLTNSKGGRLLTDDEIEQFIYNIDNPYEGHGAELNTSFIGFPPGFSVHKQREMFASKYNRDLIEGFREFDFTGLAFSYIGQVVKRVEHDRVFGEVLTNLDFGENPNAPPSYRYEAEHHIVRTLAALKDHLSADDLAHTEKVIAGLRGHLGADTSPGWRNLSSWAMTYQNLRTLLFAPLASIPDMAGIFVRTGDLGLAFNSYVQGLKSALKYATDRSNPDELAYIARMTGAISTKVTEHIAHEMYGNTFATGHARNINNWFFRATQLHNFTQLTRMMATSAALEFITHHAKLGRAGNKQSEQYLAELGLEPHTIPLKITSRLLEKDEHLRLSLVRFVNQSILRPNPTSRPWWGNDAGMAVFFHLKSFMYQFHQTINKRLWAVGRQNVFNMSTADRVKFIATSGALLLAMASAGLELRRWIQYGMWGMEPPAKDDWFSKSLDLAQRAGVFGPLQLAIDMEKAENRGQMSFAALSGPTMSQLFDIIDQDFINKDNELNTRAIMKQLPVYSQVPGIR